MSEFGYRYAEEQLRRARHPLRRFVKRFYLDNVLRDVRGPTIDFGCGAGQLLERLPRGSVGLEINRRLVESLSERGLNVIPYDEQDDDFSLKMLTAGRLRSLVVAHVLEHFVDAESVIRKLWGAAARLGVDRIVVVVPGAMGFRSDSTHKTFITLDYLTKRGLRSVEGFSLVRASYFPIDVEWLGRVFAHHELKCVYDRIG